MLTNIQQKAYYLLFLFVLNKIMFLFLKNKHVTSQRGWWCTVQCYQMSHRGGMTFISKIVCTSNRQNHPNKCHVSFEWPLNQLSLQLDIFAAKWWMAIFSHKVCNSQFNDSFSLWSPSIDQKRKFSNSRERIKKSETVLN